MFLTKEMGNYVGIGGNLGILGKSWMILHKELPL
jgi:hypothetical protein